MGRILTANRRAVPDLDADGAPLHPGLRPAPHPAPRPVPWPPADPRAWDADAAVTVLHSQHYRSLVRTSALLLRDVGAAEEVVQEAFVGLYRRWGRIRDPEAAAGYLRQAVINGSRSALRRRGTAERTGPSLHAVEAASPDVAVHVVARRTVLEALAQLPERQREVLVLRYYGDLSEAEIAAALGISAGAVKSYASRGVRTLRPVLTMELDQ